MNPRRVAQLGAGVEGDRLPDREDRDQAWRSATRSTRFPNDINARDAGLLRADDSTTWSPRSPRFAFEKFPGADSGARPRR